MVAEVQRLDSKGSGQDWELDLEGVGVLDANCYVHHQPPNMNLVVHPVVPLVAEEVEQAQAPSPKNFHPVVGLKVVVEVGVH